MTYLSLDSSEIKPSAMPDTGAVIGTPAAISASVEPQVAAIEEEPFDSRISVTTRMVYGKLSSGGSAGSSARCARLPWPISRLPTKRRLLVSPTENGGKL